MSRWYLAPLSWLYRLIVNLRNKLFDWNILPSEAFDVPIITVGNIVVGGTGKTPHAEYIIDLLKKEQKVAFLSRGYKRKTHGYHLADSASTVSELGDEPCQVWRHHPDIHVAVDANRRRGIHRLCDDAATADTSVVVLDDAYQHRYVEPGISILLCDCNRMPYDDHMLPVGRLREPFHSRHRAHIVIVTKCPAEMRPIDYRILSKHLALRPYQRLFFSTYDYGDIYPLDGLPTTTFRSTEEEEGADTDVTPARQEQHVLLVCGIASPAPLIEELQRRYTHVTSLTYPDHHTFTKRDIQHIAEAYDALPEGRRLLITTEKDAPRLHDLPESLRTATYVLPLRIRFLQGQQESFDNYIINYVRKNPRNSIVHQRAHAHRS